MDSTRQPILRWKCNLNILDHTLVNHRFKAIKMLNFDSISFFDRFSQWRQKRRTPRLCVSVLFLKLMINTQILLLFNDRRFLLCINRHRSGAYEFNMNPDNRKYLWINRFWGKCAVLKIIEWDIFWLFCEKTQTWANNDYH